MTISLQKSFVPLASVDTNGRIIIEEAWRRTLEQLFSTVNALVAADGGDTPGGGITFADSPPYRYGDLVFTSGALELTRFGAGTPGQVLTTQGVGTAPVWADVPASPAPAPAPVSPLVLYALSGAVLNTQSGSLISVLTVD